MIGTAIAFVTLGVFLNSCPKAVSNNAVCKL